MIGIIINWRIFKNSTRNRINSLPMLTDSSRSIRFPLIVASRVLNLGYLMAHLVKLISF